MQYTTSYFCYPSNFYVATTIPPFVNRFLTSLLRESILSLILYAFAEGGCQGPRKCYRIKWRGGIEVNYREVPLEAEYERSEIEHSLIYIEQYRNL